MIKSEDKYKLNIFEKESIQDYMKVLKEVDPNLSDRMRSYYKKQFMEILSKQDEFRNVNENLVYKLLGKIEELKGDIKELKDQNDYYKNR
jgi:hypothetical protein